MSGREWRLRQNQAWILIGYVIYEPEGKKTRPGRPITSGERKISFEETEERLIKLTDLYGP